MPDPMQNRFRIALLSLFILPGITPTVDAAPAKKPAKKTASVPKKPASSEPKLDDAPLIAALKQIPNGPGLFVAEPVAAKGSEGVAAFGAGCGRWLHLAAAGQPYFDRTPQWWAGDHIRTSLKRKDLRLTAADAPQVARILGITHLAVGE